MIEIKLDTGQDAYEIVGEYVDRFFEHEKLMDDCIIRISLHNEFENKWYSPQNEIREIDFINSDSGWVYLNDWWEGESAIRIYGIKFIRNTEILDGEGIYENTD